MPDLIIVNKISELSNFEKFGFPEAFVNAKTVIHSDGRSYKLIGPTEKYYSIQTRIGRIFLATLILMVSIGMALLSKTVREYFAKKKVFVLGIATQDISKNLSKTQLIFKGTQQKCDGLVSVSEVKKMCDELESKRELKVHFNKNKITQKIDGGTCSSMALHFVDCYFKIKNECNKLSNSISELLMIGLTQIKEEFTSSSKLMRNEQAAYNTIELEKGDELIDYAKNKVQSLANYHNLTITHASNETDLQKLKSETELVPEINALPEGAYFVRILKASDNEKLEEVGHSVIYIKEHGINLLYDPNKGLKYISESDVCAALFDNFKYCYKRFGVHNLRFYQLEAG